MNYIILDMEWDTAYAKKHSKFINQILQIGAVKLDSNLDIIDTFDLMIKSSFAKKVSSHFSTLTGITTEMMQNGISLKKAFLRYNNWADDDAVTMTWSNSDLYTVIENERYILEGVTKLKIKKYLDLQKYIQNEMKLNGIEINSQISLAHAAEILKIETENFKLHTAIDDSLLAVALLKKCYNKKRFNTLIFDTANPDFLKRLSFKTTYIDNIHSRCIDRSQLHFTCEKCGEVSDRLSKWKYKKRWFFASFKCHNCNTKFIGKISFKKTYDTVIVNKKTYKSNSISKRDKKDDLQHMSEKVLG